MIWDLFLLFQSFTFSTSFCHWAMRQQLNLNSIQTTTATDTNWNELERFVLSTSVFWCGPQFLNISTIVHYISWKDYLLPGRLFLNLYSLPLFIQFDTELLCCCLFVCVCIGDKLATVHLIASLAFIFTQFISSSPVPSISTFPLLHCPYPSNALRSLWRKVPTEQSPPTGQSIILPFCFYLFFYLF